MILTTEGKIEESPDAAKPDSLADYIDSDVTEPYLTELFAWIDHSVSR